MKRDARELARDARVLEDLTVCWMEKVQGKPEGFQDLHMTEMASWCERQDVHVHLGSARRRRRRRWE